MLDIYKPIYDLEREIAKYAGAKYCVAVNSCTAALLIAIRYSMWGSGRIRYLDVLPSVRMPKKTYVGVAQSIINANCKIEFDDYEWEGYYFLFNTPVVDSARYFTSGMYKNIQNDADWYQQDWSIGPMVCCSFHATKILGDTQGGVILHDNPQADELLRKMRFDGRTDGVAPKNDDFTVGYHCMMTPDVAVRLLHKLTVLPKHNDPLPNDDYPDLSQFEVFNG